MYVRLIQIGLSAGISTPEIRGMSCSCRARFSERDTLAAPAGAGHSTSSPLSLLPLLVFRVRADDPHRALAADDLAVLTNPFDARSNLHDIITLSASRLKITKLLVYHSRIPRRSQSTNRVFGPREVAICMRHRPQDQPYHLEPSPALQMPSKGRHSI